MCVSLLPLRLPLHFSGLVYTCLVEKVLGIFISNHCKRRLKILQESDVNYMAKSDRTKFDNLGSASNRDLYNLSRFFQQQEVLAMSWTFYHNAALHVHRYEKHSKQFWAPFSLVYSSHILLGDVMSTYFVFTSLILSLVTLPSYLFFFFTSL